MGNGTGSEIDFLPPEDQMVPAALQGQVDLDFIPDIILEFGLLPLIELGKGDDADLAQVRKVVKTVASVFVRQDDRIRAIAIDRDILERMSLPVGDPADEVAI